MEQQPNNPLHGVKLLDILEYLLENARMGRNGESGQY